MNRYIHALISVFLLLGVSIVSAQPATNYWSEAAPSSLDPLPTKVLAAHQSNYQLDLNALSTSLLNAPIELNSGQTAVIELPNPDGKMERFEIAETQVMHPQLAARYPAIKTYQGRSLTRPNARLRFSVTEIGFQAKVFEHGHKYRIERYSQQSQDFYQVFWEKDVIEQSMGCEVTEDMVGDATLLHGRGDGPVTRNGSGGDLLTYRMALASDYTFSQEINPNPTKPIVMAALAGYVNNLNGIYENEFAIRFELVANNDELVFLDAASDPYSNHGDVGSLIGQNQGIVDARIGFSNYDIGHVFTGGGGSPGIASRSSLCTGSKARGVSRSGALFGNTFAHEVGHQCGTGHVFNLSCSGNRTSSFAYEPASGTTVMSYGGRCFPSIVSSADDYFNVNDYQAIFTNSRQGNGDCAVLTASGNTPPTADAGPTGMFIPIQTPFELTAVGTDADGDAITYCWEQHDLGPMEVANTAPTGNAPIFRSFPPTTNPTRVFPQISDVIAGSTSFGERYPTYDRDLTFRVTVRDNNPAAGGVTYDQMAMQVTSQAGPFVIQSPNGPESYTGGQVVELTWDPANTQFAPVDADSVDIYLSDDGGFTYDYLLKESTVNDGVTRVFIPNITTITARFKIKASNNVFFDITNNNSSITATSAPDIVSYFEDDNAAVCAGKDTTLSLIIGGQGGLTGKVKGVATSIPTGLTVTVPSDSVALGDVFPVEVQADASLAPGTYTFRILLATAGGASELKTVEFEVLAGDDSRVETIGDDTGDKLYSTMPGLAWHPLPGASSYTLQVATSPSFASSTLVAVRTGLEDTLYRFTSALPANDIYFWRVSAITVCGVSPYSIPRGFEVGDCETYAATDVPLTISSGSPTTETSRIQVTTTGLIADANVLDITGSHDALIDLRMTLSKVSGPAVGLFNQICSDREADFQVSFDDEAPEGALTCPPEGGEAYMPDDALGALDGLAIDGEYVLSVQDLLVEDGGELTSWALELCAAQPNAPIQVRNNPLEIKQYQQDVITQDLLRFVSPSTATTDIIYTLVTTPAVGSVKLNGTNLNAGDTFTQEDLNTGAIEYLQNGTLATTDSFYYTLEVSGRSWFGIDVFNIIIEENVSIDAPEEAGLMVYPNPSTGLVTVELADLTEAASVEVYNQAGQKVQATQMLPQGGAGKVTLDLGQYAEGLYLIKLRVDESYYTRQVRVE